MRHAILALGLAVLLFAGCQHIPFVPSDRDKAFEAEYGIDARHHGRTSMGSKVIFPVWLATKDRPDTVKCVDSYLVEMKKHYPDLKFYWERLIVFIHDNLDWMIGPYGMAVPVYGWRMGRAVYVAWRSEGQPKRPRKHNPLDVLPHEVMHAILEAKYGDSDPSHKNYFPTDEVKAVIAAAQAAALPVELSKESVDGAVNFEYEPWTKIRTVMEYLVMSGFLPMKYGDKAWAIREGD